MTVRYTNSHMIFIILNISLTMRSLIWSSVSLKQKFSIIKVVSSSRSLLQIGHSLLFLF